MPDTVSLSVSASKDAEGAIDEEALGDAIAAGNAIIAQALADAGFARSAQVFVGTINDSNSHTGSGEDFDPIVP